MTGALRSLTALMTSVEPDPNGERILERLKEHAATLADATDCRKLPPIADALTQTCTDVVAALDRRHKARQQDLASFFAKVRESIASLIALEEASGARLTKALAPLEAAHPAEADIQQVIAEQTQAMQAIIREHHQTQQPIIAALTQRLALAEEQLSLAADEAFIDPLTRVSNRRGFDLALEKRIKELDPSTPLVLALFDIDGLKMVNEVVGQSAGDSVLRHVAWTIRDAVRTHDVVARIGHDEIALIASGLTLVRAQGRLKQIIAAIAEGTIAPGGAPVSVSCGAVEFSAGDTLPTMLHRSDLALREAKTQGRGSVVTRQAASIRSFLRPTQYAWTS